MDMEQLLAALAVEKDTHIVFTLPNADMERNEITHLVHEFTNSRENARAYTSLGQVRYLSCMKHVDAVVGNSSSGVIEAPAVKKPSIDIGDRQKGRGK